MPVGRSSLNRMGGAAVLLCAAAALAACGGDEVSRELRMHIAERAERGELDSVLVSLYGERTFAPRWFEGGDITKEGRRTLEALALAEAHGLRSDWDAEVRALVAAVDTVAKDQRDHAIAEADVALSSAYAAFANDLARGRLSPADVQRSWRIRTEEDGWQAVSAAWNGDDPVGALELLEPMLPQYRALMELRERLTGARANGEWQVVPDGAKADRADRGPAVAAVRARLMASIVDREREAAARGLDDAAFFDEHLAEAVRSFQKRHGLNVTGALNDETRTALNVTAAERLRAIDINLERWRWLPRDLGDHIIFVNIPAYEVYALEEGRIALSMKAVVGKPEWRTAIFRDTMTHFIVNPFWNVPGSIMEEDLLPKMESDAGYLDRNGYEVVDSDGNVVGSDGFVLAWLSDPASGLRVRQRPGEGNALGRIKFMFPNAHDIYLHDTPARHLFSEPNRALSHGCIRLEDPVRFARYITRTATDRTMGVVEEALAQTQPRQIDLDAPLPVYLAYFTVWVDEDGTPRFLPDVYGLDRDIAGADALQRLASGAEVADEEA